MIIDLDAAQVWEEAYNEAYRSMTREIAGDYYIYHEEVGEAWLGDLTDEQLEIVEDSDENSPETQAAIEFLLYGVEG